MNRLYRVLDILTEEAWKWREIAECNRRLEKKLKSSAALSRTQKESKDNEGS